MYQRVGNMIVATKVLLTAAAMIALCLGLMSEARGQGMISAKPAATQEDVEQTDMPWLKKIDAKQTLEDLREPLTSVMDEMSRELLEKVRPGLWDSLPDAGRRAIMARVHEAAPRVVDNLIGEMKADMPRFIDLQYMAVTMLVRNKAQLNKLVQTMGGGAIKFIRRSGIYFGFAIGLVQMVAWGVFHNPWIMPGFGFSSGLPATGWPST